MHRPVFDNAYLHPYYEPSWRNPLNQPLNQQQQQQSSAYSRNVAARRLKFPEVSPQPSSPGLTQVLSSFTPSPTIIMIEKKRPGFMQNKALRVTCITIMLISLGFLFWSKLWSSHYNGQNDMMVNNTSSMPFQNLFEGHCDIHNCSSGGSSSELREKELKNYASIIFSVDDDDETYVEDIFPYTVISKY